MSGTTYRLFINILLQRQLRTKISVQLIFWLLIIGVTFGFNSNIMPITQAILLTSLNFLVFLLLFYINHLYLFNKYYNKNRFPVYFLIITILVVISTYIFAQSERLFMNINQITKPNNVKHPEFFLFIRGFFWLTLIVLTSNFLLIQEKLQKHLIRNKEIEEEKLHTELKFLKAQINPHFLFNALNNIYSHAYLKLDIAPESILKLSKMLRYVIEDCAQETVVMNSEIEYIENFIAFQKMKSPENININFEYDSKVLALKVTPLLFMPFLENSFKYSKIEETPDAFISLKIYRDENRNIQFEINNSKPSKLSVKSGSGIGITNTKKRLNLIYPNKHELIIKEDITSYHVSLKLITQ